MKCRRIQDQLFEYVEGTLSADALAAAEKHIAECDACRQTVEKEKRLASALSSRLRQSSQALTLQPEIRRNILAASRQKASAPTLAGSLIDLCKYWVRMAIIPAAMLLVAGVLLAIHFSGKRSHERVLAPVTPRMAAVTSTVSVRLSYHMPRREFHQEGNLVIDALVDETVVADETIPSGSLRNLPQKLEIKTPL